MLIGILGGGQLGRMLACAALDLGHHTRHFDPDPQACGLCAGQAFVGSYDDPKALQRFAQGLDVCTLEFENVSLQAAREVARLCPLLPGVRALEISQDRVAEKDFFNTLQIATPRYRALPAGAPAPDQGLLKTRRLGYDGKGQVDLDSCRQPWEQLGMVEAIWEEKIPFSRELSQIGARSRSGQIVLYPLVETIQRQGILCEAIAPARQLSPQLADTAKVWVTRILEELEYVGVLALELFEIRGELLANEMAPRVHNSGHWTDRGCAVSQFENHIRAILDLPLGDPGPLGCSRLLNLIGQLPPPPPPAPGIYTRLYGKTPRPGRKLGHITLVGSSETQVDSLHQSLLLGSAL